MSGESLAWFLGQVVACVLAYWLGRRVARAQPRAWKTGATSAAIVVALWPLMRFFPAEALRLIGARRLIFVEVTGIIVPAVLLFAIAAVHVRPRDRRALHMLLVVCGIYFVRSGLWMVGPPMPESAMSRYADGACRQSTSYTCVAASLVTLLNGHGIDATETEMARLSYTEVNRGATDSRAVYALQCKLAGQPLDVCYERMDGARLRQVELPCIVPIEWGYFVSHMVPVLSVRDDTVVLGDPLTGRREMDKASFLRVWLKRGIYLHDRRAAAQDR